MDSATPTMNSRSIVIILFCAMTLSPAIAGMKREGDKSEKKTTTAQPPHESEKMLLDRLVSELKRSSRSFIYLRSVGFDLSDEEFDQLIARNNRILAPTRIVRYDKDGTRHIPGWPGVRLTPNTGVSRGDKTYPPDGIGHEKSAPVSLVSAFSFHKWKENHTRPKIARPMQELRPALVGLGKPSANARCGQSSAASKSNTDALEPEMIHVLGYHADLGGIHDNDNSFSGGACVDF
jgi:hypothetical protein